MPAERPGEPAESPDAVAPPRTIRFGWYVVAMAAYIGLGYVWKPVLMNWTLGPLFLVTALYVVPTLAGKAWSRLRAGSAT